MTEKNRSDWRQNLFNDKYEEMVELVTSINFAERPDRSVVLIADLLDTFGAMIATDLSGKEVVENAIQSIPENATPLQIYLMKYETLKNYIKIGFEENLIKEVIPNEVYVDDYEVLVAVIAANGVEFYDLPHKTV